MNESPVTHHSQYTPQHKLKTLYILPQGHLQVCVMGTLVTTAKEWSLFNSLLTEEWAMKMVSTYAILCNNKENYEIYLK